MFVDLLMLACKDSTGNSHTTPFFPLPSSSSAVGLLRDSCGLYTDNTRTIHGPPLQMLLTGEMVSADAAAEMGLINTAVDADELDDAVATLAASIASKVQRRKEEGGGGGGGWLCCMVLCVTPVR